MRDHVRLTIQPFDAPPSAAHIGRIMDQLQSDDMLLFSTDFPHWQFDGDAMLPAGIRARAAPQDPDRQPARHLSPSREARMMLDAPLAPARDTDADQPTRRRRRRPASRSSMATCIRRCARSPTSSHSCRRAGASISRPTARAASSAWATSPIRSRRRAPAGATPGRTNGGTPGSRPRPHPHAIPRRLRHRVRHPRAARHFRPERAQPGVLRGAGLGRQRLAARALHGARAAAAAQPSSCRTRTPRPPSPRSSGAPTIRPMPRCSC